MTNAAGKRIIEVLRIEITGEPNSITQRTNSKGGIDRNYYGNDGRQIKQVSNNNHGKPKVHPFGKHGEHAHDYTYDENGNLIRHEARDLNVEEREENSDIL